MKMYLAGPLFSEAERAWLSKLRDRIVLSFHDIEVFLPQEFDSGINKDHYPDQASRELFSCCISHLESADMVIAVLDGPMVDDGTAWEIGYFFHYRGDGKKPIIGLRKISEKPVN